MGQRLQAEMSIANPYIDKANKNYSQIAILKTPLLHAVALAV